MYLAVDIGGTKTLLAVMDETGKVVEQFKFPTPQEYGGFLQELTASIQNLTTKEFAYTCAAVPARLNREHGVAIAFGNRPWENLPIATDIGAIVHCPLIIENDAKCAGLSEALLIKDKFSKVLYVTISTGIGAALVINGKLDAASQDNEVGQMLLEYEGKLTDWEDFGSARAFSQKYGKRVSDVAADDHEAWYYFARNIAVGLIDLIAVYSPEAIVLGGGGGAHLDKYRDRLQEQLKIYESPMLPIPPILKAQRAEEAVLFGCYKLIKSAIDESR